MDQNRDQNNVLIDIRRVSKAFPGVLALDQVNLCLRRGEVHGLMGENGAGKSTLIKVLTGLYPRERFYSRESHFRCLRRKRRLCMASAPSTRKST